MNDPPKAPLVPPRPNLGPEPLADPGYSGPLWLAVSLAGLAIAAILIAVLRRRRRRSAGRGAVAGLSNPGEPASTRDRLIALSPSIRSALTGRLGPSYLAKTTEELAADGRIGELLGPADFDILIGILNATDRLKFATPAYPGAEDPGLDEQLAACEPSVARLTKALEAGRNGKTLPHQPRRGEIG